MHYSLDLTCWLPASPPEDFAILLVAIINLPLEPVQQCGKWDVQCLWSQVCEADCISTDWEVKKNRKI